MRPQRKQAAALVAPILPARRRRGSGLNGLTLLKLRGRIRQCALFLRPVNAALLALSAFILLVAENEAALLPLAAFACLAWGLERLADPPQRRRRRRIIRDRRSVLLAPVIIVPQTRRAARIVHRPQRPVRIVGLPPDRPRSRALDRREAFPFNYAE